MNPSGNPLLEIRFPAPFDEVRAEHVEPGVAELLRRAGENRDALASSTSGRTYANTLHALDHLSDNLDYAMSVVRHLEAVATTPELRAAHNAVQGPVSEFYTGIPLNDGIWNNLKNYAATAEARSLDGVRRRFLTKTIDSFRRHGAELPAEGKKRLAEIDVELTRLTTKFSEHVLDSTNQFELYIEDEAGLAGLPESARAAARESAASRGREGWRFTLHAPSYLAVMTYLNDRAVRETLYRAYNTRATAGEHDNRQIIVRILELRGEKARLLGYSGFPDFVIEERMAHTGERARAFLEDLRRKTESHFHRENAELEAFAGRPLEAWDIGYWAEKLRASRYDFDEEMLRPYFPLESVVAGMFDLAGRLFGVRVTEKTGVPVWDSRVTYYELHDIRDGRLLGGFYADWFPRDNKRGGAWMDALITGAPWATGEPHLGFICGNLTPPAGGKPALLTHRDVETIFHEFGHLLHHLLSRVEVRSLCGTSVPWDFVELPSQIMENWCWEKPALDLFARHYETGETIPGALFERMKRARTFRAANAQMRQLGFGIVDLRLHSEYRPEMGDVIAWSRNILQEFSAAQFPGDHAMIASFTHLFGSPVGYGAGYYSYKWAEVLDADAFSAFRHAGVFDAETGRRFREEILARGDSDDPAQLFRNFMGRDPDPDALLIRQGLHAAD